MIIVSMMSDDEEGEEEVDFAQQSLMRKISICLLYFAICLFALLFLPIGGILLEKFLDIPEDVVILDESQTLSPFNTTRAPNVYIIYRELLNFSDASEYCTHLFRRGHLLFPKTLAEEIELKYGFMAEFMKIRDIVDSAIHPCGSKYLIGLRKVIDFEWQTEDKQIVFGPPLSTDIYSKSFAYTIHQCSHLVVKKQFLLETRNCESIEWNCFMCQSVNPISANQTYRVYRFKFVKTYIQAADYCQRLPGRLASVPHVSVLRSIRHAMLLATEQCKTIGIGNRFLRLYESANDIAQNYTTKLIQYPVNKYLSKNCIVIDASDNYVWKVSDCSQQYCFICQN